MHAAAALLAVGHFAPPPSGDDKTEEQIQCLKMS
jgi:hypothetical protein